jgi:integrase
LRGLLLGAALKVPCRYERGELRPWTYHCLFGLLSVSGLRLGEARNLELQDVDLKAAVLTIRGTTAEYVWDDRKEAQRFLTTAHAQLEGQRPIDVTLTELGARRVEELLWKLYYGIAA